MSTVNATDSVAGAAIEDDPFYEVVLGDPLLLRSEFDDLIDASWGPREPGGRAAGVRPTGRPGTPSGVRRRKNAALPDIAVEEGTRHVRTDKRSPPPKRS